MAILENLIAVTLKELMTSVRATQAAGIPCGHPGEITFTFPTVLIGIAIAGLVITVVSSLIALAKAQKLLADTPENHYKKSGSKPMKKVIS